MKFKVGDFIRAFYARTFDQEKTPENHVIGPISIYTGMLVVALGAKNVTLQEILHSLKLKDLKEIENGVSKYVRQLPETSGEAELVSLTRLYSKVDIKADFEKTLKKHFDSELIFARDLSENATLWAERMNKFISETTRGKIENMVSASMLEDSCSIIINAMYFKASWYERFSPNKYPMEFTYLDGSKKVINFMSERDMEVLYHEFPELHLRAVKMILLNSDFNVMIILPDRFDGLKKAIADLFSDNQKSKENFEKVFYSHYRKTEVDLSVPKFKLEKQTSMVEVFQNMGMKQVFTDASDLTNMFAETQKITSIIHQATFEINENGVEASAVTMIKLYPCCATFGPYEKIIFDANHPFIAAITTEEGLPLFIGHVTQPLE